MVRFWREDEAAPWRVTLRSVANDEQLHFADLAQFKEELSTLLSSEGD